RPRIADMREVVDGRAADIEAHAPAVDRLERLPAPGQRVVELDGHGCGSTRLDRRVKPAGSRYPASTRSAAFSPIMMQGALVLALTSVGMIEASATRKPASPCTFSLSSTTAMGSLPILQVPTGCHTVLAVRRM